MRAVVYQDPTLSAQISDKNVGRVGDRPARPNWGRRGIAGNLEPPSMDPDTHTNMPIRPYSELGSEESFFVKAAGIAGGFASRLMERSGLASVLGSLEYVTYNGSQPSRAEADEHERLLRARVGSWETSRIFDRGRLKVRDQRVEVPTVIARRDSIGRAQRLHPTVPVIG